MNHYVVYLKHIILYTNSTSIKKNDYLWVIGLQVIFIFCFHKSLDAYNDYI